jgi:hypothetical protein
VEPFQASADSDVPVTDLGGPAVTRDGPTMKGEDWAKIAFIVAGASLFILVFLAVIGVVLILAGVGVFLIPLLLMNFTI